MNKQIFMSTLRIYIKNNNIRKNEYINQLINRKYNNEFELFMPKSIDIKPKKKIIIDYDIKMDMNDSEYIIIPSRYSKFSSLQYNNSLILDNSNFKIEFENKSNETFKASFANIIFRDIKIKRKDLKPFDIKLEFE